MNTYFKALYGQRVHKIAVDAGLTCPNRDGSISKGGCIYCNARGSGTGAAASGITIRSQLENSKAALSRRYKANLFVAYFQSYSNTYAPLDRLRRIYDEALSVNDIVGLSIGTRPDCVDESILELIEGYARDYLVWVEYGLQSANDRTLKRIHRGHDRACFENAVRATQNRGINICAHVIIGLPGETRADLMATADTLARLGVDGVKLHVLYVVKNTVLHSMYKRGEYQCLTQDEYMDLVCAFIARIPESIVIQRLTGDPHPDELVAPAWTIGKRKNLNMVNAELERRNIFQGACSIQTPGVVAETPYSFSDN